MAACRARGPTSRLPLDSIRGQLILGNAATGKSAWSGRLFGLAIFNRALDAKEVAAHQAVWARGAVHELAHEPGLAALYSFAEGAGQQVSDHSPNQHHLFIPSEYVVLYKTVLGSSRSVVPRDWYAARDIVLNLLGFVPFGFLTFIYYRGASTGQWLRTIIIATLTGATLSLVIEIGQVWLPTRHSSLLDLALNTAGSGFGALLAWMDLPWSAARLGLSRPLAGYRSALTGGSGCAGVPETGPESSSPSLVIKYTAIPAPAAAANTAAPFAVKKNGVGFGVRRITSRANGDTVELIGVLTATTPPPEASASMT